MIHVIVRERDATAQATEPITSGSVGLECSFRFSEDWDGLGKAAIFQGSGQIIDVALVGQESCVVPHEVLQQALGHLKIGVYGTGEQGQRVTPTIWADAGRILPGVEPSEIEPTPATQSLVQQILEAAENAEEIAQSVRDDADAGEFDGEDGVSPSISVTDITGGHRVTITDADGTNVFDVMDGDPGAKGDPGDDGFSPEVSVTTITGGHRVTITDAEGANVFDVMDGEDGGAGVTYYSAAVASDGTLTMPADMPTPTEIKASVGSGASLPLLRVYDRSWTNGSDQELGHRNYYYELRYAERPALTPIFAKFNNVLKVPSSGELIFVEVEGVEENGSTTWTISKETLGGDSGAAYFPFTISDSAVTPGTGVTPQAIYQAYTAGKAVFAVIVPELEIDEDQILPLTWINELSGESYSIRFDSINNNYSVALIWISDRWVWQSVILYQKPNSGIPKNHLASAVQTSLDKADSALQSYTETDPTVPSWAKESSKPSYTASEVGAIAAPSSPATGAFLVWNGTAWVAQTLATWQGGNY